MPVELKTLASKRLAQPIKFPFTAYSHIHDLLAIVVGPSSIGSTSSGTNYEVHVFRIISGQVAFTIKRSDLGRTETAIAVTALAWRSIGTSLGVGWSDGKYGIYDGWSGRQLSLVELPVEGVKEEFALDLALPVRNLEKEENDGKERSFVAVLGFMEHEVRHGQGKGRTRGQALTTDDWYNDGVEGLEASLNISDVTDLPRAIAGLDITTVLPRLSAIPSHGLVQPRSGAGASKFGTQAATDTQFDSQKPSGPNIVVALLACAQDGNVQVLLDDTVKIGCIETMPKPIAHAAHPYLSTHAVLCDGAGLDDCMRVTHVDLPLSTLDGPILHVIATNTKRVQTLVDYVVQTARCMQYDYRSNLILPRTLLNFLNNDLKSKHAKDGGAAANLYHLAMTGSFHPQVLEWIVDTVAEDKWKRWETSMNTMYTNIQSHLFENLIPALDRLSVALVALRGQAQYHEDSSSFECSPKYFDIVLENVDCIRLVAQRMQLVIQSELRESRAFLRWLKMQREIAEAEPFSTNAMEIEEREVPNIDYPLVLTHIKNNLLETKLAIHIESRPGFEEGETCSRQDFVTAAHIRDMSYERTKEAITQLDSSASSQPLKIKDVGDPGSLVNMPALVSGLVGRAADAVEHITQWQKRIIFPPTDPPCAMLEPWQPHAKVLDISMRLLPDDGHITNILSLSPTSTNEVSLHEVMSSSTHGLSDSSKTTPSRRRRQWSQRARNLAVQGPSAKGEILDAKLDHNHNPSLLTLFRPLGEDIVELWTCNFDEPISARVVHRFTPDGTFKPESFLVGGRQGKSLCVVFGNRGRDWKVLDLDGGPQAVQAGADADAEMAME